MDIGSGLVGSGIAQVSAQAGYNIIMNDVKLELVDKGFNSISSILDGQVKKEKITAADKNAILSRVSKSCSFEDAKKADFIIEAAFKNFDVKKSIFEKLDTICKKDIILATNTSSIPITSLAFTNEDQTEGMKAVSKKNQAIKENEGFNYIGGTYVHLAFSPH